MCLKVAQHQDVSGHARRFVCVSSPGEKIWRMPVEDSYWDIMKSPIADMKASCRCSLHASNVATLTCCLICCRGHTFT